MLTSHINKFGFVQKGGFNKALFASTSTRNYCVHRKSNVYFCGFDAAKGFGRINHFYLFYCLIVNTLHAWFMHLEACVKRGSDLFAYFSINYYLCQGTQACVPWHKYVW